MRRYLADYKIQLKAALLASDIRREVARAERKMAGLPEPAPRVRDVAAELDRHSVHVMARQLAGVQGSGFAAEMAYQTLPQAKRRECESQARIRVNESKSGVAADPEAEAKRAMAREVAAFDAYARKGVRPPAAPAAAQAAQAAQAHQAPGREYVPPVTASQAHEAYDRLEGARAKQAFGAFVRTGAAMPEGLDPRSARLERKTVAARPAFKAFAPTDASGMGSFTALASTYSVDQQGDQVMPGAFRQTIADAQARQQATGSKGLLPVCWQHNDDMPLGYIVSMQETPAGLQVSGVIDTTTSYGADAWKLLSSGVVGALSIGYFVQAKHFNGNIRVLDAINLFEISVVTIPAQSGAVVQSVG